MINFKDEAIKLIAREVLNEEEVSKLITTPPDYELGDYAFPCFAIAKEFRKSPIVIAEELSKQINSTLFEKIEAKAGYLNFYISKKLLAKEIFSESQLKGEEFGKADIGKGKNIVVEYSSPNIAKPFHIGHIRSTIIGDSLKRIYSFLGYTTISYNHIGDYGTQFGKLIVAIKRWGDEDVIKKDPIPELLKLYVKINEETENDPELLSECRAAFASLENGDSEALRLWNYIRDVSLVEFNRVYKKLGIEFDEFKGEAFYSDKMDEQVKRMEAEGILEDSEGAKIVNLDEFNISPALIIKSDGSTIYLTRDVAAAYYRNKTHNPEKIIYVVATEQLLHFKQLKYVLKKMNYDFWDTIIHVPFGMVSLKDGALSTRKGRVVYLEHIIDKAVQKVRDILTDREKEQGRTIENKDELANIVGVGAMKFQELFNQRIKDYVFDLDRTLSFEGETGPYVQYTHARLSSILEKGELNKFADGSSLSEESEFKLLRLLYNFTNIVIDAHEKYEPYFITRYITEIAKEFNSYYAHTQILTEDQKTREDRLMLVYTTKNVIKSGLALLGIEAPSKM